MLSLGARFRQHHCLLLINALLTGIASRYPDIIVFCHTLQVTMPSDFPDQVAWVPIIFYVHYIITQAVLDDQHVCL